MISFDYYDNLFMRMRNFLIINLKLKNFSCIKSRHGKQSCQVGLDQSGCRLGWIGPYFSH